MRKKKIFILCPTPDIRGAVGVSDILLGSSATCFSVGYFQCQMLVYWVPTVALLKVSEKCPSCVSHPISRALILSTLSHLFPKLLCASSLFYWRGRKRVEQSHFSDAILQVPFEQVFGWRWEVRQEPQTWPSATALVPQLRGTGISLWENSLPYYFAVNLRSQMILKTSPALITCYHLSSTSVTLPTCPCMLYRFPFQPTVLKKVARCVVSIGLHVLLSPQLYLLFPQQH